mmetsp:Transcript_37635/g.111668  ORF Transcript_37635/g.111668 Transcript_37635/m.111668 type:complete len:187 (-) Transcript_37635:189-749(-)
MFAETLAECRSLAAQAGEELKKVRTAPETERTAISAAAYGLLKQADDNLRSLQLEAKAAPASERSKLAKDEELLRTELRVYAQDLEAAKREFLLGGCNTDRLFLAREARQRTTAVTESLRRGSAQLKDANRQAAETEHIGVETLQELRKQRETIHKMKDGAENLSDNLNQAQAHVKELDKNACTVM